MGTLLGLIMASNRSKRNRKKKKRGKYIIRREDLWMNILKRLPVKYLHQVRCVCRSWNSLVSSPSFRTLYLNSNSSAPAIVLGVQRVGTILSDLRPYGVQYGSEDGRSLTRRVRSKTPRVDFIDVIHGVVCIAYKWESSLCSATLWNPSIHKYVSVPWPPSIVEGQHLCYGYSAIMGFGYSSSKNDFKVVTLFEEGYRNAPRYYEVFSVQDGIWRKPIEYRGESNWTIWDHMPGLFTNGAVHWVAMVADVSYTIFSADLPHFRLVLYGCERNELKTIELPLEVYRMCCIPTLKVLTYGFSVLNYNPTTQACDVWAMEEYGVATSWRKMLSLNRDCLGPYTSSVSFVFQPNLLLMDVQGARDTQLGKEFLLEDDKASVFWMNLPASARLS